MPAPIPGVLGVAPPARRDTRGSMSPMVLYLVGFAVLVAGVAYGAYLLGVPGQWIGVTCLVLMGLGFISAAAARMRAGR